MSGVYIHIPLCHSKCAYCDFYSRPSENRHDRICSAIAAEFGLRRHELDADPAIRTLYIGGGTPSILSPENLATAISSIPTENLTEFTIEVNPEDVTPEKVAAWRSLGINRVSMGVQSFVDRELEFVGRRHTAGDAMRAYEILRRGGFTNISLDLIYGLPLQTLESWQYSLDRLLALSPEHFSAYALSYEPGTRLYAMLVSGKLDPVDDDTVADMYDLLEVQAGEAGFLHYEISNFARPDFHSRHNSSYWDSTPYLGLGPAAHSFDSRLRRYNPSDTTRWLDAVERGESAAIVDPETDRDRLADIIFTRLRTAAGLPLALIPDEQRTQLLKATKKNPVGKLVNDGHRLYIPQKYWLISDSIIRTLLP